MEAATPQCPRCHIPLQREQVTHTPLEECTQCGGLWVDASSFDHICSDAEARAAAADLNPPPPSSIDTHVHYLNCPQCGKQMNRKNYAAKSGVVLCVCRPHGIWLDRDDLRKIADFISAGGLDRAHKLEAEQLQRQQREQLASKLTEGQFKPGALNVPSSRSLLLGSLASVITDLFLD